MGDIMARLIHVAALSSAAVERQHNALTIWVRIPTEPAELVTVSIFSVVCPCYRSLTVVQNLLIFLQIKWLAVLLWTEKAYRAQNGNYG